MLGKEKMVIGNLMSSNTLQHETQRAYRTKSVDKNLLIWSNIV